MSKYFIRSECSGGSLAIEKHLRSYIRDKYANNLVSDGGIQKIIADLNREQRTYFETHRGSEVQISLWGNIFEPNTPRFIHVGSLCITLLRVQGEIL